MDIENIDREFKAPPKLKIIEHKNGEMIYINKPYQTFRGYVIMNCNNCKIYVLTKTLKLLFVDCMNCDIVIQKDIVGLMELLRCKNVKATINANIPIIQKDLCVDVDTHYTGVNTEDEIKYVCSVSYNINSYVNGLHFELPCNFFTNQVFVTIVNGILYYNIVPYAINNVEVHLRKQVHN